MRLDRVLQDLDGHFALQRKSRVVSQLIIARLPPSVLDQVSRYNVRQHEGSCLDFDAPGLDHDLIEDSVFLKIDRRAIWLDSSPRNIGDCNLTEIQKIHGRMPEPAIVENFGANIML